MPKTFQTTRMSIQDLMDLPIRNGCAWKGCEESFANWKMPKDWRWLSLWYGPPGVPPWGAGNIEDRDGCLCPKHAQYLHNHLLRDIGQHLKETEGSA